ncbi:hypothetical protein [Streptomyces aureoversilis]|uniref:Uncharacterized protein n=1 Tax=Streptomyces aureoversilis TaxID=67277 RepID=A0ABW0A1T7_9ACTN
MALAFKSHEFDLPITPSSNTAEGKYDIEFPTPIREDDDGYVVRAALQSFKFENFVNGNTEDWEIGGESVALEVAPKGRRRVTVTVRANIRPQEVVAKTNPAFQFRATVNVLVIADLAGSSS